MQEEQGNKKSFVTGAVTCFCVIFIVVLVLQVIGIIDVTRIFTGSRQYARLESQIIKKGTQMEGLVDKYYLDDIDEEAMETAICQGIAEGLGDKYAQYYPADEYDSVMGETEGTYNGIGVSISIDEESNLPYIVSVLDDSPAKAAGVLPGDRIQEIDKEDVTGYDLSQVQELIQGEVGTTVTLLILREEETLSLSMERESLPLETAGGVMLDENIGYIQVTEFRGVTTDQFSDALDELESEGQEGLIIDLRDNGGGLMDTAVEMLDCLLPAQLVVYSVDKNGDRQEYYTQNDDAFEKPLAILVNENTASASEVFSGALQDSGAGVLVGAQTFGKGIVQGMFSLGDGSLFKFTTAHYYTPNGRDIHGVGLKPDIAVDFEEEEAVLPDSQLVVDSQLKAAWDYLTGQVQEDSEG